MALGIKDFTNVNAWVQESRLKKKKKKSADSILQSEKMGLQGKNPLWGDASVITCVPKITAEGCN